MRDPTAKSQLMDLFVSVQKKTKIVKKVTPFGKRSNDAIELKEKASKLKKTDVRLQTATPVWDATFEFTVLPNHIQNIIVDILVYSSQGTLSKDRVIGGVRLARQSTHKAMQHWQQMVNRPGFSFFVYYTLH